MGKQLHFAPAPHPWELDNDSDDTIDFRLFLRAFTINKKKGKLLTNSNTNYHIEMEFVSINMVYCLLQSDALKFVLGTCLHGGSVYYINFFNLKHLILKRSRKAHRSNCLHETFHISNI